MSAKIIKWIIAAAYVALLLAAVVGTMTGCASAPTSGTQQIDKILTDGTLDKPTFTDADRGRIKAVLARAKSEIVTANTAQAAAERKAERSSACASALGWLAAGLGAALILCFSLWRLLR